MALAACGPNRPQPLSAFDGRVADWTQQILADSPELATQAGVTPDQAGGPFANRLDDRSENAVETRRSAALRREAEIREFDSKTLTPAQRLTYDVLREQFEEAAGGAAFDYGDFSPLNGIEPYVLNQMDSAFITLPSFFDERVEVHNIDDAQNYLSRLKQVSTAIDQETDRARADAQRGVRPPLFIIDETIATLDSMRAQSLDAQPYLVTLKRKLDALVAAAPAGAAHDRLQQQTAGILAQAQIVVRDTIVPAEDRAALFLRVDRDNATDEAGVARLPQGADFYAAALKINTTTDLTPDQIHQIGLDRVHDLTNQLDIALRRIGLTDGPVGARLATLTADKRYQYEDSDAGRAQLMADVQNRVDGVMRRAPQWFGHLPHARLEVRRVPAFAEAGQPGGYYSPPSLDGSTPGVYHINLRSLAEMTKIDLPTQDFHEAVPGHHFQIALAQEQRDTPLLRRLLGFNAYTEGWALYAEQLADEQGLYENDPVGRIGYLRWQLWRAARLVVDTGLHAQHWTRQQAIDYIAATTGDQPGTIATEVDRYIVWPGQACSYELGRREIERLREYARNTLGQNFDLRTFHDQVLLPGAVPLNVLDANIHAWVAQQSGVRH
jgi:uncharacterized protein (DUF885 family)